jgi:RNA polymerase sigma factor for flagellar operon FliA
MMDSLRRLDPVSRRLRSFQRAAKRATCALGMALGRAPEDAEVAAHLGLTASRFEKLARELYDAGCEINGTVRMETAVFPVDQLPTGCGDPERLAERTELRATVNAALGILPHRYRAVIRWRHFEGLTMSLIGARLGISEGRVSQIHARAIRRLREYPELRTHA